MPSAKELPRIDSTGRAYKGSQRQIQTYVNEKQDALNSAIAQSLSRYNVDAHGISWVSPLAQDNYLEYRDSEFLERVGLGHLGTSLSKFWAHGGPRWDALAQIKGGCLLVEAKSHVSEIESGGCQASIGSRRAIEKALEATRNWLGVSTGGDWTGKFYQCANRYAHLYFLTQIARVPAYLINVYFIEDPCKPTSRAEWDLGIADVRLELRVSGVVPFSAAVFLKASS